MKLRSYLFAIFVVLSVTKAYASDVTVAGTGFLLDGKPWIAEGVVLVGLLAPGEDFKRPSYAKAYRDFNDDVLKGIKDFGADTIRLKANEPALDPNSASYRKDYPAEVIAMVKRVRKAGFVVIVSMLRPADTNRMPDDVTVRAWQQIIGDIGQDRGVMLEIFDEPGLKKPSKRNWRIWQKGMQDVVNAVRTAGARNVVLLDGLRHGKILRGAPDVEDPTGQLAYAVHPYFIRQNNEVAEWDKNFGDFAKSKPVMATEWNALSNRQAQCEADTPKRVENFFSYLRQRNIGLVLWAYDLPGVGGTSGKLTTLKGQRCGNGDLFGAGEEVKAYFKAH